MTHHQRVRQRVILSASFDPTQKTPSFSGGEGSVTLNGSVCINDPNGAGLNSTKVGVQDVRRYRDICIYVIEHQTREVERPYTALSWREG